MGKWGDEENWFEIFKTGTHTDSAGNTKDWTEKDIAEIVASYNPELHEAPIVIGHPDHDSPAYGWIEALKIEGDKLLAKPKQLVDQFKDWISKGLYKKVSIALYPDLGLRHVGFLGGTPPAIKGLKQAAFGEKKAAWIIESELGTVPELRPLRGVDSGLSQFANACSHMAEDGTFIGGFDGCVEHMMSCEGHDEDSANKICAYIGRKAGKIHVEKKGGTGMEKFKEFLSGLKTLIVGAEKDLPGESPGSKFTEVDLAAAEKRGKDLAFAEAQKKIEVEVKAKDEAQKKLKEIEIKARKDEIHSFCEGLAKEGKIIPAWMKAGIEEFLFNLDTGESIKFAEGQEKSRSQWFKDFITELPKVVTFKEVARDDGSKGGTASEKLMALTEKKMKEKKDLSFSVAFAEVQKENIELAEEYLLEIHPKK
jgi:hypothetical protein